MWTVSTMPNWKAAGVDMYRLIASSRPPLPVQCRRHHGLRLLTAGHRLAPVLSRRLRRPRQQRRAIEAASATSPTRRRAQRRRRPRDITTTARRRLGRRPAVTRATTASRRRPGDAAVRPPCRAPATARGCPTWRRPATSAAGAVAQLTVRQDIDDSSDSYITVHSFSCYLGPSSASRSLLPSSLFRRTLFQWRSHCPTLTLRGSTMTATYLFSEDGMTVNSP